jgi:hypothetical protein
VPPLRCRRLAEKLQGAHNTITIKLPRKSKANELFQEFAEKREYCRETDEDSAFTGETTPRVL